MQTKFRSIAILFSSLATFSACANHSMHGGPVDTGGLDQRGATLYIALGHTGGLAVVDVGTWSVKKTLTLSSTYLPHHLSLSQDNTHLLVAAPATDLSMGHAGTGGGHTGHAGATTTSGLFLLDSRTGDMVAQTEVDGTAHNAAFLTAGSITYALAEHGMVHFADSATLASTGEINVGGAPLEVTPIPGTSYVMVADSSAGKLIVVDTVARKVNTSIPTGTNPIGAWLGAGGRAHVTSEADRTLTAIDTANLTALGANVQLAGVPGQSVGVRDGTEVWVALEDQQKVVILSALDLSFIAEVVVGEKPHGLATDATGSTVYLTDEASGKLFAIDAGSRTITKSLDLGGAPNGIKFRPALISR